MVLVVIAAVCRVSLFVAPVVFRLVGCSVSGVGILRRMD